jgi:hypothetical protein
VRSGLVRIEIKARVVKAVVERSDPLCLTAAIIAKMVIVAKGAKVAGILAGLTLV